MVKMCEFANTGPRQKCIIGHVGGNSKGVLSYVVEANGLIMSTTN